jgi:hypothetical protein
MRQPASALLTLLAAMCGSLGAVDINLGTAGIQRAIAVARQPPATRAAFHRQYIVTTGPPIVERFEVTTELRRLVRAIEERQRRGNRSFRVQDADVVLRNWRARVGVAAHLKFHPLSALVTVPQYELLLMRSTEPEVIRPIEIRRQPLDGPPDRFASRAEPERVPDGCDRGKRVRRARGRERQTRRGARAQ